MMKSRTRVVPETCGQDRVFQLSLTEIAFVIAFLVIFLLGWMIVRVDFEKKELLAKTAQLEEAALIVTAVDKAKADLQAVLGKKGAANADQLVSELVAREKVTKERDALRQRIDQLETTVSSLMEAKLAVDAGAAPSRQQIVDALTVAALVVQHVREQPGANSAVNGTGKAAGGDNVVAAAHSALTLKRAIEESLHRELGRKLVQGQEAKVASELVSAARVLASGERKPPADALARDNRDLRGQVAFLKGKLEGKGGRDYPPCWAEETTGKVQYLFAIDITEQGLIVRPAWPEARSADAQSLPGMDVLTGAAATLPIRAFKSAMQGIDEHSRKRNCRHYVVMRNRVSDLAAFNAYRFAIEHYFYKLESQS